MDGRPSGATFAGMSRVPDVAVYAWDRIPRNDAGEVLDDFTEPPDVAIEVVSPGQSTNRLLRRCLSFVGNGVRAAVLVDPDDRSLIVVRPGRDPVGMGVEETLDLSDMIAESRLEVAKLFDALRD